MVLDKTGTLTFGQPQVRTLLPAPGADAAQLLGTAASAELRSEHPLGKTIVAHATTRALALEEPERFGYTPGRGIDALLDGERVLVGNQALMRDHGVVVPAALLPITRRPRRCWWRAPAGCSARSSSPMPCARKRLTRSKRSTRWASGRYC